MKKAQMGEIGMILMAFIGVIVGIALFISASQSVGSATTLSSLSNHTITGLVNNTVYYFTDYKNFGGTIIVTNQSSGVIIASGNYTITNNVVYNGALAVKLVPNAVPGYGGGTWNISVSEAQQTGYIDNAGGRGIAGIILVFAALSIAVVALVPTLRSGVLDMIGR
jgi:hypothetical protein